MRLAPLVLLAALTVGCTSSPTPATPPSTTTTTLSAAEKAERGAAGEATKQLLKDMNKTTTSARPRWCATYDAWKRAGDDIDRIESRYGSKVSAWPDDVLKGWETMLEAQTSAGSYLWDLTEAGTVPRGWGARARACR